MSSVIAGLAAIALVAPAAAQTISADRATRLELALRQGEAEQRAREQKERERELQERAQERAREQAERQRESEQRAREQVERQREMIDRLYEQATADLDAARWEAAVVKLQRVAEAGGLKADGAVYWKAYADVKRGQIEEALAGIEALKAKKSKWLKDAEALQLQIKQASGQKLDPATQADEDLKLMAINSLMHTGDERALPMLEQVLKGSGSPKLKERALFVLTQSRLPQARAIITNIARGDANPDLQLRAIKNLGVFGSQESRETLSQIYGSATDPDVKRAILQSMRVANDRARVLQAAQSEKDPDLRREAIRQLGLMRASAELSQLYDKEANADVKKQLVYSLFLTGQPERIIQIARSDGDPEIRLEALRRLGTMGRDRTGTALADMYKSEKDPAVKSQIIRALFVQGNATALIQIARAEQDPNLKKEVVQRLSNMTKSPEVADFMIELLKK